MSDGESPTPSPRKRPSYGLPGPSGPSADPGLPAQPEPGSQWAQDRSEPFGSFSGPSFGSSAGSPAGPAPSPQAPRRKQRGLLPLIIGIVLLVVVAPVAFIGGIFWSMSSVMEDAVAGPTVLEGGSGEVEVAANEMLLLYVPAADAEAAECSAEAVGGGSVSTVRTSGTTQFGDGTEYEQTLGVAALEDTTVAVTCSGTEAPAYLGPYSLLGVAAPLLIGPIIGVVAGLIGLVLIIIGIVLLVRSRSS
ncbi:MAG TPA: hypothetical protein H9786_10305 [Candidatus Brachybacterium merdavium]|uniref:Uncharacterized protein n=1 Tax=Candidatus Brachybacterium merdavium TaxID=2838513 RepID=A0A9D2LEN7_9MICO|nr:hypothetical protein [Candidatus Brachybacterium merdavium]